MSDKENKVTAYLLKALSIATSGYTTAEGIVSEIQKEVGESIPVHKQLDEEEMIAIEPLYIKPNDADAHGDGITEQDLRKMVDNFNDNISTIKSKIHHQVEVDGFHPVKAWVNEVECYIGDTLVPELQPVVKMQFTDKTHWERRKASTYKGVSIGALGKRIPNPDYIDEDNASDS
jgi:methylaspartate ammonia-lyase